MALFLIKRSFAEALDVADQERIGAIADFVSASGMRWIESFLTTDRLQSYCLYEAPSPEAVRESARALGLPVDTVIEVTGILEAAGGRAS